MQSLRLMIRNYDVAEWAASYIKQRIIDVAPTANHPFVLGLPTGGTPLPMYQRLIDFHQQGDLSFKHVVTFNMDDYVGLPATHPASYHTYMVQNFFAHIDIPHEHIHMLNGNALDLDAECRTYEQAMRSVGGIELFVGGLGENGHIAFNEPGSSLTSRTHLHALADSTRIANARFFNHQLEQVPTHALTVGVGTIMDAREVMLLATGNHKAIALAHVLNEPMNSMWPASVLQLHPKSLIVCDRDATLKLTDQTIYAFEHPDTPSVHPQ